MLFQNNILCEEFVLMFAVLSQLLAYVFLIDIGNRVANAQQILNLLIYLLNGYSWTLMIWFLQLSRNTAHHRALFFSLAHDSLQLIDQRIEEQFILELMRRKFAINFVSTKSPVKSTLLTYLLPGLANNKIISGLIRMSLAESIGGSCLHIFSQYFNNIIIGKI